MAAEKLIVLRVPAAVTGNEASPPVLLGPDRFFAELVLDVPLFDHGGDLSSALTVMVETAPTPSPSSGWTLLYTSVPITAAAAHNVPLVGCDLYLRARWTMVGFPALVTMGLGGTSHLTFCNNDDVDELALPPSALAGVPPLARAQACLSGTDEAVSYLGLYYDLPLTGWGNALRLHTANIAAYYSMKRRGFDPQNDELIRLGYTDALAWLNKGAKSDPSILDTTPTVLGGQAFSITRPARGWAHR